MSAWTLETLREHLQMLIEKNDQRCTDQFNALERATRADAVNQDQWRHSSNAWREAMSDRERNFLPRAEYHASHEQLQAVLDELKRRLDRQEGRGSGLHQGWMYLTGGVALISVVAGFMAQHWK